MSKEKDKKIQKAVEASFSENRTKTVEKLAKEAGISLPTFCRHRKAYKDDKNSIKVSQESFNDLKEQLVEYDNKIRALKITEHSFSKDIAELLGRILRLELNSTVHEDRLDYLVKEVEYHFAFSSRLKRSLLFAFNFSLLNLLFHYFFSL